MLVLNIPTPEGWMDESFMRVPWSGVEPRPLASQASVLPLGHLLSNQSIGIFYIKNELSITINEIWISIIDLSKSINALDLSKSIIQL